MRTSFWLLENPKTNHSCMTEHLKIFFIGNKLFKEVIRKEKETKKRNKNIDISKLNTVSANE